MLCLTNATWPAPSMKCLGTGPIHEVGITGTICVIVSDHLDLNILSSCVGKIPCPDPLGISFSVTQL